METGRVEMTALSFKNRKTIKPLTYNEDGKDYS